MRCTWRLVSGELVIEEHVVELLGDGGNFGRSPSERKELRANEKEFAVACDR